MYDLFIFKYVCNTSDMTIKHFWLYTLWNCY